MKSLHPLTGSGLGRRFPPCGVSVRSSSSILLSLAVLIAFLEAPFLHTHQHEATQRHPGPAFHLHLKLTHAASKTHEFRGLDPDDDAQLQSWFSVTPTDSRYITPALLAEPFSIPVLERGRWAVEAPFETGHDPPFLAPRNPRAPPA